MPNNETWSHYYLLWFRKTNSLLEKRLWIIKWFFSNTYKEWNYKREKSLKLVPRLHFRCEDTACVCETGWRGHRCEEQDCDPRCSLHGQCKNGTCLCVAGWNGLHCTLEGCPRGCSNHGSCKADFRGEWSCHCHQGWEGPDCSVRLETRCSDGYDDDQGKQY